METSDNRLNLADLDVATDVLGPGRRVIVWVQGCPNCITPRMLDFVDKRWIEPEILVEAVLQYREFEGITLVGGEPFSQAKGLCAFIDALKTKHDSSVFAYSGYTLEEIQHYPDLWMQELLNRFDILVDGEYREELACDLLWWGGTYQ